MRTTFDLSPLYRSTVGFDRLFELLDGAAQGESAAKWPPYDIERTGEDTYRISMAVAGFAPEEIELTQHDGQLYVSGAKAEPQPERQMLHQGIAFRNFRTAFSLADHVKVLAADMRNGLLSIELVRVIPEQLKPRRIEIGSARSVDQARPRLEQAA